MATYRKHLPQLAATAIFLTDGGLETTLIYQDGFDLPYFAAFHLLKTADGRAAPARLLPDATPRSPSRTASASSSKSPTWRAQPPTGGRSSATTPPRSPTSIATRSR